MKIETAEFHTSAPNLDVCPAESIPEFAFIGRSNVGKSSLLNMLTGHENLAKVSKTPGFTKLINFFTINNRWRLVDLPGYGYAKTGKKTREQFNQAVTEYLDKRETLLCVFALIDSSLPPQNVDLEFIEWLVDHEVPFVLTFTKTDKVKQSVVNTNVRKFMSAISDFCDNEPISFRCSALKRHGRQDLLDLIEETIC